MGDQLHTLTAVLPGKWAISHSKHGWLGPRGWSKQVGERENVLPPTGVQI